MPGDSIIHRHRVGTLCISKDYTQRQQSRKEDTASQLVCCDPEQTGRSLQEERELDSSKTRAGLGGKPVSVASSINHKMAQQAQHTANCLSALFTFLLSAK